jgi:transposase
MGVRYIIGLNPEERVELEQLTKTRKSDSRTALFARALLLSDKAPEGPGWSCKDVCEAVGFGASTLERLKKRFVEEGLSCALERKQLDTSRRDIKLDGAFEARLIALACSPAPEGRARQTVRLLAEKAVELEYVDAVSAMSARRILKKTKLSLAKKNIGKFRRK